MTDTKQLMIQRLVDGELDRQQVRNLLHQAESESVMYRQIALAMVENQIWEKEICQLESADDAGNPVAGSEHSGDAGQVHAGPRPSDNAGRPRVMPWRKGPAFLALAMTTLLMTWLGYSAGFWQSGMNRNSPDMNSGSSLNVAGSRGAGVASVDPYSQYSPYRMQMVSNDSGLGSGEEFPVIPISTARELGVQYELTQPSGELQRRLNSQGYELQPEIQYIRGHIDDGRQVIVPVGRMQLRQWGQ